jgi:DNA-binding transcriptional MerR regulator
MKSYNFSRVPTTILKIILKQLDINSQKCYMETHTKKGMKMKKLSEIAKEYEGHTVWTQKAADIAGVPTQTLQDWFKTGLLDFPGQGTGRRREFNIYDIILIGICKSLTDQGLRPKVVRRMVFHLTMSQPSVGNVLKKYLTTDECFAIIPTQDEEQEKKGVISDGTGVWWFDHDDLPNALDVMRHTMAVGRDMTILININRIAKRILKNASGEIG